MEKRIIPITFRNDKLKSIISEIIAFSSNFENLKFHLTDTMNLHNYEKSILVTDDESIIHNRSIILEFSVVFIINTTGADLKIDKSNKEIILISIPFRISDMFQRIFNGLNQIEIQTARKLKFKKFTYDPSMRTLFNNDFQMRFTEKESQIFICLIENSNTHLSKKNLLKKVWSYNDDIDTHTLETHIYSLRKKIEKNLLLKNLIVFEDNKGYFLDIEIL